MKHILHLAVDYPCVNRPENTLAVKNLIGHLRHQTNTVFALTRTANPFKINLIQEGNVIAIRYWGLPFGMGLFLSMSILALRIFHYLKKNEIKVDMIHGHKFAFEGISAWWLSKLLKVPFMLSIRGEAERKVLKFKPYYNFFYQRMINDCSHLFYISAWFKGVLNNKFSIDIDKQSLLPNFVAEKELCTSSSFNADHFVTILDINVYKKKGLDRLLLAIHQLLQQNLDFKLDIIGRGEPVVLQEVSTLIEQLGLKKQVTLLGTFSNKELLEKLPHYAGLLLPSQHETFGMVYVEALLSSVPILCSKQTGIDGFIDWLPAHISVDPYSVDEISFGIKVLLEKQHEYRKWLVTYHNDILKYFGRERYVEHYEGLLKRL